MLEKRKNKFRKLVPQTGGQIGTALTKLIQKDRESESNKEKYNQCQPQKKERQIYRAYVGRHLKKQANSQEKTNGKIIVFQRRLKTISSLQERDESQYYPHSSSLADYSNIKNSKLKTEEIQLDKKTGKIYNLVNQFKRRAESIMRIGSLQQMQQFQKQNKNKNIDQLINRYVLLNNTTKQTSAKLIHLCLSRLIKHTANNFIRKLSIQDIPPSTSEQPQQTFEQQYIVIQTIPKPARECNNRRNLMNINKFFSST